MLKGKKKLAAQQNHYTRALPNSSPSTVHPAFLIFT
jgi:hypothetical protein